MKPRFDDWSIFEYGFDGSCTPSFQMIPHGDIRSVWLYDSDGMDVKSVVPGIVGIEELASPTKNLRIFKLKGLMAGRTFVEVRKNSTLMTRLEAVVAPEMTFTASFNYVSDRENIPNKGWTTRHKTVRDKDHLDDMIEAANKIFVNQINVRMIKKSVRDVVIDRNLGDTIDYANDWNLLVSKGDKSATLNVYFVWQLDDAAGAWLNRTVMVQDELGDVAPEAVLAHEIGHFLGMPDENRSKKAKGFLMSTGSRLRRNEMLAMRKILANILKLSKT